MDREISRGLMEQLNRDAERIAARFALAYHSIDAERPQVKRRYGVCFSDGRIRIRLRHAATGRPLKYSSLVNTLCHELAHLKHFNHGARFKVFYLKILSYARSEGIYRPRRVSVFDRAPRGAGAPILGTPREVEPTPTSPLARSGPEQLSLFGS
jgi:predicted metal-dependent hydrolase